MTSVLAALPVLAVAAPATMAVAGLPAGRRSRSAAVALGVTGAALALAVAVIEAALTWDGGTTATGVALLGEAATGGPVISLQVRADARTGLVSVAVALVALCVQVFSARYLGADARDRYPAYAATVSLFTAAMALVVHADDVVLLLVGWEVMGLCSYLLIGHHSERPAARAAALKAFLTTRVGDVGFLLGVVVLLADVGTTSVDRLLAAVEAGQVGSATLGLAASGLLAGVLGKSAQLPLHAWLPDAMEGPAPVSAMVHAATMVVAGVVVLARLYPVFQAAPAVLAVTAVLAATTTLAAAVAALAQDDLKRLLAWSTISQVGLMLCALAVGGAGGLGAGLFHLLSHAAFKALLFLVVGAAGTLAGGTLLARLSGLGHRSPLLGALFALGLAALAGLPPTGGFFSKEAVLTSLEAAAVDGEGNVGPVVAWFVLVAALATTFVTAVYAARALTLVLLAPPPAGPGPRSPRLPAAITVPLVVLAVPTALTGLLLPLAPAALSGAALGAVTTVLATTLTLAGLAAGLAPALRGRRADGRGFDVTAALPAPMVALARDGYRWDAVVEALVVRPVRALARLAAGGDHDVVDAYVRGVAAASTWAAGVLGRVQTGVVTGYLGWLLGAAVALGALGVALA